MISLARNSKFNINVNFSKSKGSYLYDNNTERRYLDFFGMYASLPLGYNHDIFLSEEFKDEILAASTFKINNCEFVSNETLGFDKEFRQFTGNGIYDNYHYTCTGALAVEAAIKTCIHRSGYKKPNIVSFRNSFHGINSFGSFVTDHFWPASNKLDGLPETFSTKLNCDLREIESYLHKNFVTCVLVEPIQCSAGDIHQDIIFFTGLRRLCDKYDVPLVFDEIQVGFGSTGKLWFYEHTGIVPDIVIFGKKTQLSGIMVNDKCNKIFDKSNITRLQVTWDGDAVDMIRCKYIMRAYKKYEIIEKVAEKSEYLINNLNKTKRLLNLRSSGLIMAFDLVNTKERDELVSKLYQNGLICNKTGEKSVRLRPNLAISYDEIEQFISIINKTCGGL